jgi:hypothetical protein
VRRLFQGCALDTQARELRRGDAFVPVEPQVFDLLVPHPQSTRLVEGQTARGSSVAPPSSRQRRSAPTAVVIRVGFTARRRSPFGISCSRNYAVSRRDSLPAQKRYGGLPAPGLITMFGRVCREKFG